ncbi:MAG: hypothetical protein M3277_05630 [Actinomycetota bacterium]|nr:hypothetical protein [Actinomycetota bacterium]
MTDRLDALLTEVGRELDWPELDVAGRVGARIRSVPEPAPRTWVPRLAFATAAVVALVAATLVFSPATRRAIADFLGIGGVRIQFGTPTAHPQIGSDFDLGQLVTREAAARAVDFDLVSPDHPDLANPDEIYLDEAAPGGGIVAFVYGPRASLPAAGGDRVSIVFTQFASPLAPDVFFGKKLAFEDTIIERVEVNGNEGYWLEGEPHFFFYEVPGTGLAEERIRLVGNVLLWEQEGVTLRLEVGSLPLDRALEIAQTVS